MSDRMVISCPVCGRQVSRSKSGTDSEVVCPKCGAELNCIVSGATVSIKVVKVLAPNRQPA